MKDVSLSLVSKNNFKLNIGKAPQLVESSGAFFCYIPFAPHLWFNGLLGVSGFFRLVTPYVRNKVLPACT